MRVTKSPGSHVGEDDVCVLCVWVCVCGVRLPVSDTWDSLTGTKPGTVSSWPCLLPEAMSDSVRLGEALSLCQPVVDLAR